MESGALAGKLLPAATSSASAERRRDTVGDGNRDRSSQCFDRGRFARQLARSSTPALIETVQEIVLPVIGFDSLARSLCVTPIAGCSLIDEDGCDASVYQW
jgi:hypothetical protein